MHSILIASTLLAASLTGVAASLTGVAAVQQEKRWSETYANAVQGIAYDGASASGSYNRVSSMDPATGACAKDAPQPYSGSMGPLSDDLSVHLRGPVKLSRFAVYTSSSQPKLKRRSRHFHEHRRRAQAKQHVEEQTAAKLQKRACYDWVTATYPANGAVFSFQWTEGCAPVPAATAAPVSPPPGPVAIINAVYAGKPASVNAKPTDTPVAAPAPAPAAATAPAPAPAPSPAPAAGSGGWSQSAYYSASQNTHSGLTFLNTKGAKGISGGWTAAMGNSLSYATPDGLSASKASTCLADVEIPTNQEISIFSDKACGAQNTDCGTYRPDGVNYHGFSGEKRAFFWEFSMPDHPEDNAKFNGNMPAIWLLNAQIPRTQQYGGCSAWPGAGELDVAEALVSDLQKLKATIHGDQGFNAGSDNYFQRPTGGSIILGLVLADSKVSIKILDKSQFDFSAGAGAAAVDLVTNNDSMAVANVY